MNLYIFEPYGWAYCGGAIGIVAETFDKAIEMIVEADKIQAKSKKEIYNNLTIDDCRSYKPEYFQRDKKVFKEDTSDQWLLTHKIPTSPGNLPEILFDNWNFA